MFLTQCEINPRRRGARTLLGSPQALHAAVRYAFPSLGDGDGAASQDRSRVLWRLDSDGHRHLLYTVSSEPPDFTHVVEEAGWPSTTGWRTRDYDSLLNRIAPQQFWHFRLTANPTRSGRLKDGSPTQRFGHVTAEQQAVWLMSRSAGWGFKIPNDRDEAPVGLITQRGTRTFRRGSGRVTISTATYSGLLKVVDADAFRSALLRGMGHAKAYGCGLMTLAPLRS